MFIAMFGGVIYTLTDKTGYTNYVEYNDIYETDENETYETEDYDTYGESYQNNSGGGEIMYIIVCVILIVLLILGLLYISGEEGLDVLGDILEIIFTLFGG